MSCLLVLAFSSQSGAERIIADIHALQEQLDMDISDAAVVIRKPDGRIRIKHTTNLEKAELLGDAFWGVLFGMVFFIPWLGVSTVSFTGDRTGNLNEYGINDSFIKEAGSTIQPGCSALFLLVSQFTEVKLIEALSRHKATLLKIDLSRENVGKLSEAFGADPGEP